MTFIANYRIQDQLWSSHLNLSFHFIWDHIYHFTSFITSIISLHSSHLSSHFIYYIFLTSLCLLCFSICFSVLSSYFILFHLQFFISFSMNSKVQMIKRFKIKRELSKFSSFKIEFQESFSSSFMKNWFKLLSNDLRSIVKTSCFKFVMHFLFFESFSKSKMLIKIKCELFNDTTEEHIVREENKKLQAENYVFLSYDFEKKSSHLSEKYEEISNSVDIVFVTDLQTLKKKTRSLDRWRRIKKTRLQNEIIKCENEFSNI